MRSLLKIIPIPIEVFKTIVGLFVLFGIILGVSAFVLYPLGITYETNPIAHFAWLVFGLVLVERFTPNSIKYVTFSRAGIAAVILLIIIGLATSIPSGDLVARAVKIIEIIFQDLVIAATLATVLARLSDQKIKVWFSIAFALLHVPLFFTQPFVHVVSIVAGALFISYVSISWFAKKNHDITAILLPHILFYLIFGTALSIVFW